MTTPHISRISTIWTLVRQAHASADGPSRETAQEQLLERYSGAIYRYLLKLEGNPEAADELFQEFAIGLIQGRYRHANPEKGRFRDYVKTSVIRLVHRHRRQQPKNVLLGEGIEDAASSELPPSESLESAFRDSCREELLATTWQRLRSEQESAGHVYFTVLDYRARNPDATSDQAAADLSRETHGRSSFTAASVRKTLQRARVRFAELLLDELRSLLGSRAAEDLEQELIDLQLHPWCRSALPDRGQSS